MIRFSSVCDEAAGSDDEFHSRFPLEISCKLIPWMSELADDFDT